MSVLEPRLDELGQALAVEQDRLLARATPNDLGRQAFLEAFTRHPRNKLRVIHAERAHVRAQQARRRVGWVGLAAAALLAAGAALFLRLPRVVEFTAGKELGKLGATVGAPESQAVPLRFSDGSEVVLDPGSSARVTSTSRAGAGIVIAQGLAHVHVQHRSGTHWNLVAGPYRVEVTGTRFDMAWRDQRELSVTMLEGSVEVSGGSLPGPTRVGKGQTLVVSEQPGGLRLLVGDGSGSAAPASSGVSAVASAEAAEPPAITGGASPPAPATDRDSVRDFRSLAASGDYAREVALAEQRGFDAVCSSLGAADLLALADAARYVGNLSRARQALLAVDRRFKGDASASVAHFGLGRLALDHQGDALGAARWFEQYLREQPRGPLSREALARLMEAHERSGDHDSARRTATSYLAAYPSGPYAPLAHTILDK